MDITKELPTVISFCSGYGGIERGLDLAGIEHRVIAYVEIEAFAIANLVNKMEAGKLPPAPIYTDLKTFPAHLFRDRVDLITGGYPCQPFSAAGQRKGTDDPRHLWPFIRRHIESIRPARCFFENVEGHISLGLSSVISDLEEDGYRSAWGIFSAREVGAPHQRKRVYIMADTSSDDAGTNLRNVESADGEEDRPEIKKQKGSRQPSNSGKNVANPTGHGGGRELRKLSKPNEGVRASKECRENPASESDHAGKDGRDIFADTGREGLPQRDRQGASTKGQPYAESQCGGGLSGANELADSISPRSETGIPGSERPNQEGNSGITDNCDSEQGGWQIGMRWPPEPRLGRVVDGCADRVDRLRLLGNGVVPATAAKAWLTLNEELL